jgi:hypothetical protein
MVGCQTLNQRVVQGFCQRGGWGISPPSNDSRGVIPLNLSFLGNLFSGFENIITLSVILRHLEAELIILRWLKLIS